jgi:hypothetical protein
MGSLPRLKIKDEIKYRKGSTNESTNCRYCRFFTALTDYNPVTYAPIAGVCEIIGKKDSNRYRVREDYRCDRQETTYKRPVI